jgi:hypothetical protein
MSERIHLSCGCERYFPSPYPQEDDEVYCLKCQREVYVIAGTNRVVRVKCRNCHVSRSYGTDEASAKRAASRHAIKYTDHIVDIKRGGQIIETISQNSETLPFQSVVAERRAFTGQHQASLRNVVTKSLPKQAP